MSNSVRIKTDKSLSCFAIYCCIHKKLVSASGQVWIKTISKILAETLCMTNSMSEIDSVIIVTVQCLSFFYMVYHTVKLLLSAVSKFFYFNEIDILDNTCINFGVHSIPWL